MRVLVTGGAGFIGSAFVRYVLEHERDSRVVTLDKLTYAGNLDNLASISGDPRHEFVHGDVCDAGIVAELLSGSRIDAVVHFAAESHVDRSILSPRNVVDTNVLGTLTLLEAVRAAKVPRVLLVSTDEVYGDLDVPLVADEGSPLRPGSPCAASKAAGDLLALAYVRTYRLPVFITRASNNYGPYQFPEKLIPLIICRALDGLPVPVYGDGLQVRDWLYVEDHCRAILAVLRGGREGEVYNIGGNCSLTNREVIARVLATVGAPEALVESVADRPGHDRRYALRVEKVAREVGFVPKVSFEEGLTVTVRWYLANADWTRRVRTGEYRDYYDKNYGWRTAARAAGAEGVEAPA